MRASWETVKLGDISEISYGYTAKASTENVGPKFLRITDIQNGSVDWKQVPQCAISKPDFRRHVLQNYDIVFARTGATTGKSFLIYDPPKAVAASYLIRLRLHDQEIAPEFVALYFHSKAYWDTIAKGTTGSAQGGFNASKLAGLRLPKPPLREQKRIVAILDEAFAGIATAVANTEKNIANARELFESYLNSDFNQHDDKWKKTKLSRVIDITHGFAFKGADFQTSLDVSKPIVLTPGNYTEAAELEFTPKNTKRYVGQIPKEFLFNKGDLTVVMTDLSSKMKILGKPAFVERTDVLHNQRIGRVKFNTESLNPRFMYYFLRTNAVLEEIKRTSTGTVVKHTAPKRILALSIPVPSQEIQETTVSQLELLSAETRRLEHIYQRKVSALAELKQALLQRAFSGELTADVDSEVKAAVA